MFSFIIYSFIFLIINIFLLTKTKWKKTFLIILTFFLVYLGVIFWDFWSEKKEVDRLKEFVPVHNEKIKNIQVVEKYSFENRLVVPYLEPVPNMPGIFEGRERFIDTNSNGVRDDIEVPVVESFWEDKDVVDSFFTYAKVNQLRLDVVEKYLFTEQYEEKFKEVHQYWDLISGCLSDTSRGSHFFTDTDFKNIIAIWDEVGRLIGQDKYYNTNYRRQNYDLYQKYSLWYKTHGPESNEENCRWLISESKKWNFN